MDQTVRINSSDGTEKKIHVHSDSPNVPSTHFGTDSAESKVSSSGRMDLCVLEWKVKCDSVANVYWV